MIKEWTNGVEILCWGVFQQVFPELNNWEQLGDSAAWQDKGAHWDAFNNLEAAGFIYEMAAVVSSPIKVKNTSTEWEYDGDGEGIPDHQQEWGYVDMDSMAVVYELANKDRFASDTGKLHETIKEAVRVFNHANRLKQFSDRII